MADPRDRPQLNTIEDIKLWIAEHDGRIDAWWAQQKEWNSKTEKEMKDTTRQFSLRLTSVERRMIYVAGVASGAGSILFNMGYALLGR